MIWAFDPSAIAEQRLIRDFNRNNTMLLRKFILFSRPEVDYCSYSGKHPLGLRGCGFFHVVGGQIVFQRGYWDKLSFLRAHGLPLPDKR